MIPKTSNAHIVGQYKPIHYKNSWF